MSEDKVLYVKIQAEKEHTQIYDYLNTHVCSVNTCTCSVLLASSTVYLVYLLIFGILDHILDDKISRL